MLIVAKIAAGVGVGILSFGAAAAWPVHAWLAGWVGGILIMAIVRAVEREEG